jgi:hypothetical protein
MATGAGKTKRKGVVLSIKDKLEILDLQDQSAVRPLFVDLKFLIHRPHLFLHFTRFAITPLFHTAHAQKMNFDLSFIMGLLNYNNGLL